MVFLKTDRGLINTRFIVQVEDYEAGTVQVMFQAGESLRYAIADLSDFRMVMSSGSDNR